MVMNFESRKLELRRFLLWPGILFITLRLIYGPDQSWNSTPRALRHGCEEEETRREGTVSVRGASVPSLSVAAPPVLAVFEMTHFLKFRVEKKFKVVYKLNTFLNKKNIRGREELLPCGGQVPWPPVLLGRWVIRGAWRGPEGPTGCSARPGFLAVCDEWHQVGKNLD